MRRVLRAGERRAGVLRARLADALSAEIERASVGVEGDAVVIAGEHLSRRRIDDARLRGIGILAKGLAR